jgi:hypothetical protein
MNFDEQWSLQREIEIREIINIALTRYKPEPSEESRCGALQMID